MRGTFPPSSITFLAGVAAGRSGGWEMVACSTSGTHELPCCRDWRWPQEAPGAGLPPTYIAIHTGPVIYQDGDVYGRTVNLASRIASQAGAGEVLVSEETLLECRDDAVRFEVLGAVELKGVDSPVHLYRATRRGA